MLTLLVVASALRGMSVYQDAYGFTTLRLFVDVFEGWLGFVVLAIMVAGVLGRGRWLPRIALASGAVALVGLAAINPDAWVAERNLDRYAATGKLDLRYLQTLSADAAPVIVDRLPEDVAALRARGPALQLAEAGGARGRPRVEPRHAPAPTTRWRGSTSSRRPAVAVATSALACGRPSASSMGAVDTSLRFLRPGPGPSGS